MKSVFKINPLFMVAIALCFSHRAYAFYTDFNFVYFSDTLTESSTSTMTRTFYDLSLGINIDKKGQYTLGWNYGSVSANSTISTTTTFALTEMGPKFNWHIDKERHWNFSCTYNLIVNAQYNDGSTTSKWRGTSIKADFGYAPNISESFYAGVKLNYYQASFAEEVTSTTLTTISYSRGIIYPSLFIAYRAQ